MKRDFAQLLEKDIDEKHLSKHEFYQLWNEGEISLEALRGYARQYYKFVSEFPRFVSRVHSNTPDEEDRMLILSNLNEEEDKDLPHTELWLRFAEGIGVKRNKIDTKMLPETKGMLDSLRELSSKNLLEGAAALLAYEAQVSDIATLKMKGLKKHYNLKDKNSLEFFEVHGEVDIEHQKTWKKLIAKHAKTKEQKSKVRRALNTSLESMWSMLDGVYRKYC
jgi:pyrroloquinoline-quinone synthase